MFVQGQFHDLHTGDHFSPVSGGTVYLVEDGEFIDYWGGRQIMYRAADGLHAHLANHEAIWFVTG